MEAKKSVLCVCLLCRYENDSGKYVSTATRTRHRRRERIFHNNDSIPANIPLYSSNIINRNDNNQDANLNIIEDDTLYDDEDDDNVSSINSESMSINHDNVQDEIINEDILYNDNTSDNNDEE